MKVENLARQKGNPVDSCNSIWVPGRLLLEWTVEGKC
jgi:hypothetical protein